MKKNLLIVAALEDELSGLDEAFGEDPRVRLLKTGMGAKRMQQALQLACEKKRPDFILHLGFCGGLDPSLECGHLVFSREVVRNDGKRIQVYNAELETAKAICKQFWITFQEGTSLQTDQLVSSVREKRVLKESYKALSVDMESFALADFCTQEKIPFFIVRAVFDTAQNNLPNFGNALDAFGKVKPLQFAKYLLFHPRSLFLLPKLAFCAKESKLSLAHFSQEWIQLWLQENE